MPRRIKMSDNRILWIENQLEYAGAILKALKRAGYIVDTAETAEQGIAKLRQQKQEYDLILLDMLMGESPVEGREIINGRTGLAVYDVIRDDLKLKAPIIFVTIIIIDPTVMENIKKREELLGIEHYILHKPTPPSEILQTVRSIIGRAKPKEEKDE
jgi:CheY-like chemotaxis protein